MRDKATIAIIAPLQPEDFFDLLWQGVWEATFDLSSFGVEVQNLTTQEKDVAEQRKILETLLDSHPDAIGLLPTHATALNDLIEQHTRRGTPVITFHGDAPDSLRATFVGPNIHRAGALAGEVLAKLIHGRGRILAFPGSLDEFHLAERYRGFRDTLKHYPGIREERCCLSPDASFNTPEMLASFGPAAGYYAGNQDVAAIALAIETLGVRAPCIGFSNTDQVRPFLDRGVVSAVIDEHRYQLGYFAVQKAYEAVLKREADVPIASVQIPSTVVFAANAGGEGYSLDNAFELLVRQRTEILVSYKNRLEEANTKLLDLSITDPLTGIYNRRKFEEVLNQETIRARRYGPVSLLLIDVDYFKRVNDRYGHQTGDDALKAVAKALGATCRTTDTCARLGGDEFGVILPHSDPSAAAVVRRRIEQRMERTMIPTAEGGLEIGLSIGAATLPGDADGGPELMAAADAAMYRMKQTRRADRKPQPSASEPAGV
jgi:diguanylate cyclase (GGDEF)-like protein